MKYILCKDVNPGRPSAIERLIVEIQTTPHISLAVNSRGFALLSINLFHTTDR